MHTLEFECPKCLKIQHVSLSCSNCGTADPVGINLLLMRQDERARGRKGESVWSSIGAIFSFGAAFTFPICAIIILAAKFFFPNSSIATQNSVQTLLVTIGFSISIVALFLLSKASRDRREYAIDDLYETLSETSIFWLKHCPDLPAPQGASLLSFMNPMVRANTISQFLYPNRIIGRYNSGNQALSNFAEECFRSSLQCIVKNSEGACDITFKEAVACIAALHPKLTPETIHQAVYTSCILSDDERKSMASSLAVALQTSYQNWRKGQIGKDYLERASGLL